MISLRETIHIAFDDLNQSKFRTFLAMLGIVIGVASIIIIMSAGEGAKSLIVNQIQSVGSNLIGILPGGQAENGPPASVMGITVTTLTADNLKAIKDRIPEVTAINGYVRGTAVATYYNQKIDTTFIGVNSDYTIVESIQEKIPLGRFFDDREANSTAQIAVLGYKVADELFGRENPVGKSLKIKKKRFNIIGVIAERGVQGFTNQDNQIFIPIKTAQKIMLGIDYVSFARAKVIDGADNTFVAEKIRQVLRDEHDITNKEEDDFSVQEQTQALDTLDNVMTALSFFLAAIGSIALLVGGIGIMNIMLALVNQRIKEIGLRKAVGAKNKDIMILFVIECIFITFIGALIGILAGSAVSYLVAVIARYLDYKWDFSITAISVILSCFISIMVGLIFGLYPAHKASKLDPIDSLRYE